MKSPLPLIAAASLLALSACNTQPTTEVVDTNPDPMAAELANAAPVALPPAVKAEVTMRCKDNSLLYVTLFEGDKLANVRTEPTGTINRLTAAEAGQPLTAEGWSLTGDAKDITVTQPGKPSQACHA